MTDHNQAHWQVVVLVGSRVGKVEELLIQGGLQNRALTEQISDLKSFDLGARIRNPDYTPGVDFQDDIFL